ncbi:transporter substrate-binding domain-containing protein [Palleronia sp. LCG004]|uniref:substrate-binding periplasmic protein n=1 Tax=Palleronia sp. LCG004 TaxID=3079304 RepID=UPI002942247A|nr:transporter substrate-binding domain-containing protein [Palleronia sp. LCG004]WOI57904.1 transporter substrate-binding domain-containing protein [Palleronia sp. LCG004]
MNTLFPLRLTICALGAAALTAGTSQAEIVAAADVGYAPFAMVAPDGTFEGIDIDIAKALSEELGEEIRVIDQPWSATIPGLMAGKFDMILAPATITEERAQSILFAEGYGDATFGLLLNAGNDDVTSLEDLRGTTVATNKGNLFDRWISGQAEQYDITVARFDKHSDSAQAVATGQADAALMYSASAGQLSKEQPIFKPSSFYVDEQQYFGYAFNKDDAELRNRVDAALECLKIKGEIAAIFEKWTGITAIENSITGTPVAGYGPEGLTGHDATKHETTCK